MLFVNEEFLPDSGSISCGPDEAGGETGTSCDSNRGCDQVTSWTATPGPGAASEEEAPPVEAQFGERACALRKTCSDRAGTLLPQAMDLDVAGLLREEFQRTLRLARERRAIQLDRQLTAAKHDPQVRLVSAECDPRVTMVFAGLARCHSAHRKPRPPRASLRCKRPVCQIRQELRSSTGSFWW